MVRIGLALLTCAVVYLAVTLLGAASAPVAGAPDDRPAACRSLTDGGGVGYDPRRAQSALFWRLCRRLADGTAIQRFEVDVVGVGEERLDGFRRLVTGTLTDARGWAAFGTGARFQYVREGGDFRVVLASPEEVAAAHELCSPDYSCRVGDTIWINERRWDEGVASYQEAGASLVDYRRMVVNHEVGHWLGFGHEDCPGEGEPAPVMQQQSKGLDGCTPNPWPLPGERERLADRTGLVRLKEAPVYGERRALTPARSLRATVPGRSP